MVVPVDVAPRVSPSINISTLSFKITVLLITASMRVLVAVAGSAFLYVLYVQHHGDLH